MIQIDVLPDDVLVLEIFDFYVERPFGDMKGV